MNISRGNKSSIQCTLDKHDSTKNFNYGYGESNSVNLLEQS